MPACRGPGFIQRKGKLSLNLKRKVNVKKKKQFPEVPVAGLADDRA
jgi:hypothetical protein